MIFFSYADAPIISWEKQRAKHGKILLFQRFALMFSSFSPKRPQDGFASKNRPPGSILKNSKETIFLYIAASMVSVSPVLFHPAPA
jgi:hypothetical protein